MAIRPEDLIKQQQPKVAGVNTIRVNTATNPVAMRRPSQRISFTGTGTNVRTPSPGGYSSVRSKLSFNQPTVSNQWQDIEAKRPELENMIRQNKGLSKYDNPYKKENALQKLFNPIQDKLYGGYEKMVNNSASADWYSKMVDVYQKNQPDKDRATIENDVANMLMTGFQTGKFVDPMGNDLRTESGEKLSDFFNTGKGDVYKGSMLIYLQNKMGGGLNITDPYNAALANAQSSFLSGTVGKLTGQENNKTLRSISKGTAQFINPMSFGGTRANPYFQYYNNLNSNEEKILGGLSEAAGFLQTMGAIAPITSAPGQGVQSFLAGAAGKGRLAALLTRLAPGATNAFITGALQYPGQGDRGRNFFNIGARAKAGAQGALTYGLATGVGGVTGKLFQGADPFLRRIAQGTAGGSFDVIKSYLMGERDKAKLATEFGLGFGFGARTGQDDIDALFGQKKEQQGVLSPNRNVEQQKYNIAMEEISKMTDPVARAQAAKQLIGAIPDSDPLKPAIQKQAELYAGIRAPGQSEGPAVRAPQVDPNIDPRLQELIKNSPTLEDFKSKIQQNGPLDYTNYDYRFGRALDQGAEDLASVMRDPARVEELELTYPGIAKKLQGENVKVYRAAPENAEGRLNTGDYISLDKQYALDHLDMILDGKGKIIEQTVPKSDVLFGNSQDSFQEFVYAPQDFRKNTVENLYNGVTPQPRAVVKSPLEAPVEGAVDILDPVLKNPKLANNEGYQRLQTELKSRMLDELDARLQESAGSSQGPLPWERQAQKAGDTKASTTQPVGELEGNFKLASEFEDKNYLSQVRKAIEKGTTPRSPKALELYNQIKKTASANLIDDPYPQFKKDYQDADFLVNAPKTPARAEVEKIRSITDLDKLSVNKDKYDWNQWDEFKTQVQNRAAPIEDLGDSAKAAVRKYYGAGGQAKARILEDLQPVFRDNDISLSELKDFEVYSAQKRNANLEMKGQKGASEIIYPKDGMFGKEERIAIPKEQIENPKFEKAFQQLQNYEKSLVDYAYQGGVIDTQLYKNLQEYGDYVPFQRYLEGEDGGPQFASSPALGNVNKQNIVFKYEGSDKPILSPIESIIYKTMAVEKLVNRNNVAQVAIRSMQENPDLAPLVKPVKDVSGLSQNEYISVLENGKKQYYTAPEPIVLAAKSLPNEQLDTLTKILSAPARILRQGATSSNIDFMVPNVLRDQFNAAINSEYGYRPGIDWVSGFKSLLTKDQSYMDFLKSGSEINFGYGADEAIKQIVPDTGPSSFTNKVKTVLNPIKWLQTLGEYSEVPTRIGLYKRAIENGATPEQAMLTSRTATSDFAVRGSKTKSVAAVIPFLNARIQGFDSTVQAFKNNPAKASLYTGLYAVLPTVILQSALESTPVYNQISDYDKDKYFIVPLKGSASVNPEDFIKVPKGSLAQWMNPFRKAYEGKKAGEKFNPGAFTAELAGEVSPIGGISGDTRTGRIQISPADFTPQAFRPILEVTANYDFYRNRPVVSQSVQDLPAGYQANSNTDPLFRDVGQTFNVSPAKLQQLFYGYTGGLGKQLTGAAGFIAGSNRRYPGRVRPGSPKTSNIPVVNRLVGVDFSTPDEQASSRDFEISKLRAQYQAVRKSKYMPNTAKKQRLAEISEEVRRIRSGR